MLRSRIIHSHICYLHGIGFPCTQQNSFFGTNFPPTPVFIFPFIIAFFFLVLVCTCTDVSYIFVIIRVKSNNSFCIWTPARSLFDYQRPNFWSNIEREIFFLIIFLDLQLEPLFGGRFFLLALSLLYTIHSFSTCVPILASLIDHLPLPTCHCIYC